MPRLSKKQQKQLFTAGVFLAVLLYTTFFQPTEPTSPAPATLIISPTPVASPLVASDSAALTQDLVPVTSITDGDTIKVRIADIIKTVRLVGINTPETKDPRKPVECFGQEASDALTQLLTNQSVRLETDPTQSDQDRYGRLLRFVFLPDGRDVGMWLLEQGYAQESLYSSVPHRYREAYVAAEQRAKKERRGLWGETLCEQQ